MKNYIYVRDQHCTGYLFFFVLNVLAIAFDQILTWRLQKDTEDTEEYFCMIETVPRIRAFLLHMTSCAIVNSKVALILFSLLLLSFANKIEWYLIKTHNWLP